MESFVSASIVPDLVYEKGRVKNVFGKTFQILFSPLLEAHSLKA